MQYSLSAKTNQALKSAKSVAIKYSSTEIGTEHVLYGLLVTECVASSFLKKVGVEASVIEKVMEQGGHVSGFDSPDFSNRVAQTIAVAHRTATQTGSNGIGTEHLLFALLGGHGSMACHILTERSGINIDKLAQAVKEFILGKEEYINSTSKENKSSGELPAQLSDLGIDITKKARENKIDEIIGRDEEIERIIQILCRKSKNNPILIGEPGVGKTAVIEGLAKAIVEGKVPELLKSKIVFSLDIGSLMAGTKYRGALEEKLKSAIDLIKNEGNIIVFIDEIHTLSQAGSKDGEVSPADILKPYLARGEMQTIGATTTDEYKKYIEKDKALERRFQPITVNPPSIDEAIKILLGIKENYEVFHKVKISNEAIVSAVNLSDRYITDRFLPDKAIDLIDEAMSRAKVNKNIVPKGVKEKEQELEDLVRQKNEAVSKNNYDLASSLYTKVTALQQEIENQKIRWSKASEQDDNVITAESIAEIVAKWTKIPVTKLTETESEKLIKLEDLLHKRVVGQSEAVTSVAKAMRRARAGLQDSSRPIGSFMFLGPTGVGKTELVKALSEAMFDDENAVIRLDMSEYMESHSVSKLIGAPPGYTGFDEGGQLTEQVRRKPYSVVLFDEIEKAHPDITNALLQIMDDGRLTDSQGRVVNFKNTIVIMTSNVGATELKKSSSLGFGGGAESEADRFMAGQMDGLRKKFKPEFINRIDVICNFKHLEKTDLVVIADIMLNKVARKLKDRTINLIVTDGAKDFIIDKGYDINYGARPLRRIIQTHVEDNIAEALLMGGIVDNSTVLVDFDGTEITVSKKL